MAKMPVGRGGPSTMLQWLHPRSRLATVGLGVALLAGGRQPAPPPAGTVAPASDALRTPAAAIRTLTAHLRANDLDAFARDEVPPALHARLQDAWRAGRTRWPLQELPFARRIPGALQTLAAPDAEARLGQVFAHQFAGQDRQIRGAIASLGVFGMHYLQNQGDFSADERAHHVQLVQAATLWGQHAPLADPVRARRAIARLSTAARASGLTSDAAFRSAGMDASLERMGRFAAVFKQVLGAYGLDLDAGLDALHATLRQQTGDQATVRMEDGFAGQPIDALVTLRRIDGRWYVADFLAHAEAAVRDPSASPAAR
jgi:hypothetical protein